MASRKNDSQSTSGGGLKLKIGRIGQELANALSGVVQAVSPKPVGPAEMGRMLGLDKVLCSRVLKAIRADNPISVAFHVPGPEPLRRLLAAARRHGADRSAITIAEAAVDGLERLIREEAGDRGSLHAIVSAWLPDARRQFEKTRLQAAFKAMSQIKGVSATTSLATAILHPSSNGSHIDLAWIVGSLGLYRLRPGAAVKFTSRRLAADDRPRQAFTLQGEPVESLNGLRVDEYCSVPPVELEVHKVGDRVIYTLEGGQYGPRSAADLVFAEVNREELPRQIPPDRKGYVFTEVNTPSKSLLFDVLVHHELYNDCRPSLVNYDTTLDGVASVNDPSRNFDRFDLAQEIELLDGGLSNLRIAGIAMYRDLVNHALATLHWRRKDFRGYRCRIDYPVYGSQVVMAFDPQRT